MILQDLILAAKPRLSHVKTDSVMRDLRILAAHALAITPSRLTLHMRDDVSEAFVEKFDTLVERRATFMPIAKIIQKRQFWGRDFKVDMNVLDPRGDTETLISACLARGPQARILDLGAGSGAIGLTLAAEWPSARVVCTDISRDALTVARQNGEAFGLTDRVTFESSDWFETVDGQFDLIVSNPPYIALKEWDALDIDVREFDPRQALTDESDGLSAYRIITAQAEAYIVQDGCLMVEIGYQQGDAVQSLFETGKFTDIQCFQDMAGRDRVVSGIFAG